LLRILVGVAGFEPALVLCVYSYRPHFLFIFYLFWVLLVPMFLIILDTMKIFEELSKLSSEKVEFVQDGFIYSEEWKEVKELSEKVYSFINNPNTKRKIDMINQPGKSSHDIQKIITIEMIKLGFTSEKQGLFLKYKNSGIRLDFYKKN
jgi:hypothetical protein